MAIRTEQDGLIDGIRSEVSLLRKEQFGQLGNTFQDGNTATTPPSGKVIVAITCLGNTTFTAMAAEDVSGSKSFALTGGHTGEGSGGVVIAAANVFPSGLTIYGRWTSVTPTAASTAGIICYFGY